MGSGNPQVVRVDKDGGWGLTDSAQMFTPGVVHWEAGKAYLYAKTDGAFVKGAPGYRTGTAGDVLTLKPTGANTGAKVIGVAVSDVATTNWGWFQCYGPMTYINMCSGTTKLAHTYLVGQANSAAVTQVTVATGTYNAGIFAYVLAEAASGSTYVQGYIFNTL
jgi:hypothetical protein